jgi:hypothetical protein
LNNFSHHSGKENYSKDAFCMVSVSI